MQNWFCT